MRAYNVPVDKVTVQRQIIQVHTDNKVAVQHIAEQLAQKADYTDAPVIDVSYVSKPYSNVDPDLHRFKVTPDGAIEDITDVDDSHVVVMSAPSDDFFVVEVPGDIVGFIEAQITGTDGAY